MILLKNRAKPIMIQGTHSDAGKSIFVTALCRIFYQDGYLTAPFKSQNMALNSYITLEGKEIGRAQGIQAEAANVNATTVMNPILIKPTGEYQSQIVVHGVPIDNMKAQEYREGYYERAKSIIKTSLDQLLTTYERIVIEGAGSPAEINLNDRELVNMSIAKMADAPVILVGDIDKGGVFASLVGTLQLLTKEEQERVVGVVINKFRGDISLLEPGLKWFEEYTGKPVLGVIPYIPELLIDSEDSLSLQKYTSKQNEHKDLDIAVIQYSRISNFTDIDPFEFEPDCHVRLVTRAGQLGQPDLIILPGSKNTIEDLLYIKNKGIVQEIVAAFQKGSVIFGVCGGYQMLGEEVSDPEQIESTHKAIKGLGLLPIKTILKRTKTTTRSNGYIHFCSEHVFVEGYEIHMGETRRTSNSSSFIHVAHEKDDGTINENETCMGTYFHGIFHNDQFRNVFLNQLRQRKGLASINDRNSFVDKKHSEYDRLAGYIRQSVDINNLYRIIDNFSD